MPIGSFAHFHSSCIISAWWLCWFVSKTGTIGQGNPMVGGVSIIGASILPWSTLFSICGDLLFNMFLMRSLIFLFPSWWYLFTPNGIAHHHISFCIDVLTLLQGIVSVMRSKAIFHFPTTVVIGCRSTLPSVPIFTSPTSIHANVLLSNAERILGGISIFPLRSMGRRKLGPPLHRCDDRLNTFAWEITHLYCMIMIW